MAERHWGYTRQRDGSTLEYEVAPTWRVWRTTAPLLAADVTGLYGRVFAGALSGPPALELIAEGSAVSVYSPSRVEDGERSPR